MVVLALLCIGRAYIRKKLKSTILPSVGVPRPRPRDRGAAHSGVQSLERRQTNDLVRTGSIPTLGAGEVEAESDEEADGESIPLSGRHSLRESAQAMAATAGGSMQLSPPRRRPPRKSPLTDSRFKKSVKAMAARTSRSPSLPVRANHSAQHELSRHI